MKTLALILAAYFLLGSLFPRTDFSQLTRLSEWGTHFQEHTLLAENEGLSISFMSFFLEHLLSPDSHEHNSSQDHQDLPYFSPGISLTFILTSIVLPQASTNNAHSSITYFLLSLHPRLFSTAVFQPPA